MYLSLIFHNSPGRIRTTPESEDDNNDASVLSLGLFPGEYLEYPGEDRTVFRFEAAWDSSLHNSIMLNRVTPPGEHIYMTISAYLEVRHPIISSKMYRDYWFTDSENLLLFCFS